MKAVTSEWLQVAFFCIALTVIVAEFVFVLLSFPDIKKHSKGAVQHVTVWRIITSVVEDHAVSGWMSYFSTLKMEVALPLKHQY
jgi:hypothetical protein